MQSLSYWPLIIKEFTTKVLRISVYKHNIIEKVCFSFQTIWQSDLVIFFVFMKLYYFQAKTLVYNGSSFLVGTLDYLAQSNTGIKPVWLQDIYFLSAEEWWDLKRRERRLICDILKTFNNEWCTSKPFNYFSNFLPP